MGNEKGVLDQTHPITPITSVVAVGLGPVVIHLCGLRDRAFRSVLGTGQEWRKSPNAVRSEAMKGKGGQG
jgi:hypothetical protein